jgi:ech hydrogenase subunit A
MVVPYLESGFGSVETMALSANNMVIDCIMVAVLVLLFAFFFGRTNKRIVPLYMAGYNMGDNLTFMNAMKGETAVSLRNWYMESYFGEFKMNVIGVAITSVMIVGSIGIIVGQMLGGGM